MPSLEESTQPIREDLFERVPVSSATLATPPPYTDQDVLYSIKSSFNLRCPAPPFNVSPDNLRQFYTGGRVPQHRVIAPPTLTSQAAAAGGSTTTTVVASSTTSSSTTTSPSAQTVGITTPSLNVGQVYPTVVQIAKSFEVLAVGVNSPARLELYKTSAQQAADLTRSVNDPVPIGTEHGIICDITMLTSTELFWDCSPNFPGSNADSPQTTSIYITITNLGASASAISATITFVPNES
jgi:hypothetical protein